MTTESLQPLEAWQDLVAANPILATPAPGVEALLVNRRGPTRDHYLAPIDECFRLPGLTVRQQQAIAGRIEVSATAVTDDLVRLSRGHTHHQDAQHVRQG